MLVYIQSLRKQRKVVERERERVCEHFRELLKKFFGKLTSFERFVSIKIQFQM